MGSMMYRQKPNMPALYAAAICLVGGLLLLAGVQQDAEYVSGAGMVPAVILGTVASTATCLFIAFARYRFTHLWKNTGAAHSQKYKNKHRKHHRHHHSHH